MKGLDNAMNGYYDVEDQLVRYLRPWADEDFMEERVAKHSVDSQKAFERRRERVNEQFLASIGGCLNGTPTPTPKLQAGFRVMAIR